MGQINEFELIKRYLAPLQCRQIPLSLGDDAAILPCDSATYVCTDTLVSGIHFLPHWPVEHVAYKAVAVNVSDLMAMGAKAQTIQLALTLPDAQPDRLAALHQGLKAACETFGVCLSGGDTTRGAIMVLTVTALGTAASGRPWRRSSVRPGDLLAVTGTLGDAALGLAMLMGQAPEDDACMLALQRPQLPLDAWRYLTKLDVHAAIDISDGLVQDAGHLAAQSGVSIVIELERLPLSSPVQQWCAHHGNWDPPLFGGEDYQLLVAMPPELARQAQTDGQVRIIGRVERGQGVSVLHQGRVFPLSGKQGFQHF